MSEGIQRTYLFTKMVEAESEQDFKDLANEIVEYISEKEARIARLEKGLDYAGVKLLGQRDRRGFEFVDKSLCETVPQQLAHIQADAVEKAASETMNCDDYGLEYCQKEDLDNYAQQLRDKADKTGVTICHL